MAIDIRRSVTLGELITAGITIFGFMASFWMTTNVRLNSLELNQRNAEKKYENLESSIQKTNEKLDGIGRSFTVNADIGSQIQSNTAPTTMDVDACSAN
ncbi:MAG: hypothetical protein EBY76_01315 [Betaproteobacteria bacterium]|nr:hypothetical protein [Betaproteobacteria bacterium]